MRTLSENLGPNRQSAQQLPQLIMGLVYVSKYRREQIENADAVGSED